MFEDPKHKLSTMFPNTNGAHKGPYYFKKIQLSDKSGEVAWSTRE